jgi:ATP-binding cassette subfamily B protein
MKFTMIVQAIIQTWAYIRVCVFGIAGARVVARLRQITLDAIFSQDIAFFDTQTSGALASRLTSDVQTIQGAVQSGMIEVVLGFIRLTVGMVMCTFVSWKLALLTLATFPAVAILIGPLVPLVIKLGVKQTDALARSVNLSTEVTGSMKTVISFGSETFVEMLYKSAVGDIDGSVNCCWWPTKSSHSTYRYGVPKAVIMGSGSPLVMTFMSAMWLLVSWFGYDLIMNDELTFGDLMAFMIYVFNIAMGAAGMAGSAAAVFNARASLQRIYEIVTREPALTNSGGEQLPDLGTDVCFEDVEFSYPSRPDQTIFVGLSFHVPAQSTAAFVGPSGVGKSTILGLLSRFYNTSKGRVLVGGHDLTTLDASWLRRRVGVVQQEPVLFGFDIRENIAYGHNAAYFREGPSASDSDIQRVSEQAHAHKFVSAFPDGYQTLVGERGILLSGGQKQRIAIARMLLVEPQIILLDEATSALDAESEHLVQEAIERAMKDRTTLVVAHRLSTIQGPDQIHVLADKRIVSSGTHEELLKQCEHYQDLVKHQVHGAKAEAAEPESQSI